MPSTLLRATMHCQTIESSLCNTWNFEIKMLLYWKEEKKKIAKKWFPLLCHNTSYLSKSKLKKSFSIKVHEDVMFEKKFQNVSVLVETSWIFFQLWLWV